MIQDLVQIPQIAGAGGEIAPAALPHREIDDWVALQHWLVIFELRNKETLRSYKAEANRLRIFLETIYPDRAQDSHASRFLLRDVTETDLFLYEAILKGKFSDNIPNPPELPTVVVRQEVLDRYGRKRQPFARPLNLSSVNLAISILHAMYEHWLRPSQSMPTPYVVANPASRLARATSRVKEQTDRSVPKEVIDAMAVLLESRIESFKEDVGMGRPGAQEGLALYERRRWIFSILYGLWGRRRELSKLQMGSISRGVAGWKVAMHRKGRMDQKADELPMPGWVMAALSRYRTSLGLSPLPVPGDPTPLILSLRRRDSRVTDQVVYLEAKALAQETAEGIREGWLMPEITDEQKIDLIDRLERMSPHWFRHTGATIAINSGHVSAVSASKMLGHSNTTVTLTMYHHADTIELSRGLDNIAPGRNISPTSPISPLAT